MLVSFGFVSAEAPFLYWVMFLLDLLFFGFAFKYLKVKEVLSLAFFYRLILTPFFMASTEVNIVLNMFGNSMPGWLFLPFVLFTVVVIAPFTDAAFGWIVYRVLVWRGWFDRVGEVKADQ